jgi:hypothetical protein
MMTPGDAEQEIQRHLGATPRAEHSRFVGLTMRRVAESLGEDITVWELTGLCHDLDFEVTADDRSRHGLVAAEWLAGRLPEAALQAIRAHDHRTGEVSNTPLGIALRMTDALAVLRDDFGPELPALLATPDDLRRRCAARPWLPELLLDGAEMLGVPAALLGDIARATA